MSTPPPHHRARIAVVLCAVLLARLAWAAAIKVEIEGLDEALAANVRATLSLVSYSSVPDLNETNIRALHARAPKEIEAALAPLGYYSPKVEPSLDFDGQQWIAHYKVTPGEPVVVRAVDVQVAGPGENEDALRKLVEESPVRQGAVLRQDEYERTKEALLTTALELGYRDARLTDSRIEVDPSQHAANIVLHLDTGPRYHFGEVTFEQNVLRDDVLRRYVRFAPGEPYDAKKLLDMQYALYDSEYFSTVEIDPQEPQGDRVPIVVRAEPRARTTYRVGGGYGTDTGPRVSLRWEDRRVNQRGHRATVDLTLSQPKVEMQAQYIMPLDNPTTDTRALALHTIDEDLGDTQSRKAELIARDTRLLGAWQRQLYIALANERTDIGDVSSTSTELVPGTLMSRTRTDDPILPTRGTFLSADLHGSGEVLGADTRFVRLRLDGRLLHPLGARGRLVARSTFGTMAVEDFDVLPASERFFAGGDQSVRGFDLNSLGPRNEDGLVIGGRYLFTASFEYDHTIRGPWGMAVFIDGGDAFDHFGDSLEYGAGIGARYRTPLGMLRLDFAWPLTDGDEGLHIHFGFGPEL
jgi:translocation and assembly module TamA